MNGTPSRSTELLYGRNAVIESLAARRRHHRRLVVAQGAERQERIADLLARAHDLGLAITRVHPHDLDRIAGSVNHQGVALETGPYPYAVLESMLADVEQRPIVFLDHVQDPQNLGTLMRTAEATGVAGIVIPDRRAAGVTPAVVNAAAGSVEHLRVARVTNLSRALEAAKSDGYWIAGLEHDEQAELLFTSTIPEPTGLLIGSEGKGIGTSTMSHCDVVIRIPMLGKVGSLNAAVAGSIALYELLRRRLERED